MSIVRKNEGRLRSRPSDFHVPTRSQHFRAVDVDGITFHRSSHSDMMSSMSLQRGGIIDHQHFLIAVGDHDNLRSALEAFLGAGLCLVFSRLSRRTCRRLPILHG